MSDMKVLDTLLFLMKNEDRIFVSDFDIEDDRLEYRITFGNESIMIMFRPNGNRITLSRLGYIRGKIANGLTDSEYNAALVFVQGLPIRNFTEELDKAW